VENGFTIQKLEFEDLPGYVSELNSNLNLKYNTKVTSYNSFLSKLNEYAGNKTKVFIAKKDNIVVGFSLNMLQGNILDTCFTGFKYDILTTTDFIYFNVCFYEPIRWAIKKGVKKIYYRDRGEKVKLHRGCKPENTCSFVKCHDGLLGVLINKAYRTPLCSYLSQRELKGTA
jgi:predicted N-acyltransferase